MLKKALLSLVVLLGVFLLYVALQPSTFRVERSIAVAAPAPQIFPHVNNLKNTQAWNPWLKLDPAAKVAYAGPAAGVGASSTWAGDRNVGEGRQTITESRANELVRSRLDFIKPFAGTSTAEFTLKPQGGQTVVTWALFGENNFFSRIFCVFMNQDKMIGEPFERGLASLKAIVEGGAKQ
jgi:hypothetical protein